MLELQRECSWRNAQRNYRRHNLVSISTERLKQIRHDLCGGEANHYTTDQDDEEADVDIPQFPARLALTEDINTAQGGENHIHLRQRGGNRHAIQIDGDQIEQDGHSKDETAEHIFHTRSREGALLEIEEREEESTYRHADGLRQKSGAPVDVESRRKKGEADIAYRTDGQDKNTGLHIGGRIGV